MALKYYRLDISYVGDGFYGFQSQPGGNTIQDHLESALAKFLRHPVRIVGASRTDSGVHARQQVVVFSTTVSFAPTKLVLALHALMPPAIAINSLSPVPPAFHPIRDARAKLYSYKLWTSPFRDAHTFSSCWWVKHSLDITAIRHACGSLIGRHDFASFCAADSSAKTTERLLFDIRINQSGPQVTVWILGEGFLKQMVRAIVGTLVQQSHGTAALPPMADILKAQDRCVAGMTAPAHGLTLERVFFRPVTMITAEMMAPQVHGCTP